MEDTTIADELLSLVKALSIAAKSEFMAREHASAIWKRALKATAFDILPTKKEIQNGATKKN